MSEQQIPEDFKQEDGPDEQEGSPAVQGEDAAASSGAVDETLESDEVPSRVDAVGAAVSNRPEGVQYSDMVCPLISAEGIARESRLVDGPRGTAIEVTTREPEQVLVNPVECPTCHIMVEHHQLVFDKTGAARDCAMAIQNREHPTTKELIAAHDAGDHARMERIAKRHPVGERILEILGLRNREEEAPA